MSKKFAVFDIDGTLLRWQLYHSSVNTVAKQGLLGEGAYEELRTIRMAWKNREHPEAFKDYERYIVDLYDSAITGLSVTDIEEIARKTVAEHKQQVYTYTRDLIRTLKDDGYFLLAISGSQHEMIEEVAKFYGFDDWVGSTYEIVNEKFSGKKEIASDNKSKHLQAFIDVHKLEIAGSIGVGDTASDIAFLERVETPIAFNPERKLFDTARKKGWKIVIERKNVVYELEKQTSNYELR